MKRVIGITHSLKKIPLELKVGISIGVIHLLLIGLVTVNNTISHDTQHSVNKLIKLHLKDLKNVRKQIVKTEILDKKKPNVRAYQAHEDNFVDHEVVAQNKDARAGKKLSKLARKMGYSNSNPYKLTNEDINEIEGELKGTGVAESSNSDYVTDVPLGDITYLNSVKNKYYGFYHRIRSNVEQHWSRILQSKVDEMYTRGSRVPASVDRMTNLVVTMNVRGQIIDVKIMTTSGISEFDEVAIESFNKAGPFPNPPKDLIKNGVAKIEWGFVVRT